MSPFFKKSYSLSPFFKKSYSVLSNPEFLAEGNAINDLENPDRVLIGGEDDYSINLVSDIYSTMYWLL